MYYFWLKQFKYDLLDLSSFNNMHIIILIFILSFISIYYAFDMMFNKWYVEWLLSAFFSCLFVLIYILLVHTFSKAVLPSMSSNIFLNTSNVFRVGYVIFMGFVISQPLETFILKDKLDADIASYKTFLLADFENKITLLYKNEKSPNVTENVQIARNKASNKVNNSEFFVKRVQLANAKYPVSWIICFLVITLFFLPGFLIYSISGQNAYYQAKHNYEKTLVVTDYELFKEKYSMLFENKLQMRGIAFYEPFEDPPFNTIRKKDKENY